MARRDRRPRRNACHQGSELERQARREDLRIVAVSQDDHITGFVNDPMETRRKGHLLASERLGPGGYALAENVGLIGNSPFGGHRHEYAIAVIMF